MLIDSAKPTQDEVVKVVQEVHEIVSLPEESHAFNGLDDLKSPILPVEVLRLGESYRFIGVIK